MAFDLPNVKNLELAFGLVLPEVNNLFLEFNGHMSSYMGIEDYYHGDEEAWISPEEREMAVANNSVWNVHWYSKTPIGFYHVLGASLESVFKKLGQIASEEYPLDSTVIKP